MDAGLSSGLARHPDRLRWNDRYHRSAADGTGGLFVPHPLAVRALSPADGPPPDGPVLDLACGLSGSALAAAAAGRRVAAVDISDVALCMLEQEAARRGVGEAITLVHADVPAWRPRPRWYALVLCTGYWDREVFGRAAEAVAPGGLLGWEAFTAKARRARPALPVAWCLRRGEPASLLPAGFSVVEQRDLPGGGSGAPHGDTPHGDTSHGGVPKRRLLARRGLDLNWAHPPCDDGPGAPRSTDGK